MLKTVDIRLSFNPLLRTAQDWYLAKDWAKKEVLSRIEQVQVVVCTYVDNIGVSEGDLVEVPFGAKTNLGIVVATPSKLPLKKDITYKEILRKIDREGY